MTEWRPVLGYEGFYSVSDRGDVVRTRQGAGARAGTVLKHIANKSGYPTVGLCVGGRRRSFLVHRLVAFAFLGEPPVDGMEICHNNGNPADPRATNLRWDTHIENQLDVTRHGRCRNANKTECPQGHPYDDENTYVIPSTGGRMCRICKATRDSERRKVNA